MSDAAAPVPARRRGRRPVPGGTPWYVADDLAAAVAIAGDHGDVLVVDLENTLVGYGSTDADRRAAMAAALAAAAADGRIRRLAFVSNARFALAAPDHATLAVVAVPAARKPHLVVPPLRRHRAHLAGAAVYGDQPLTDGLLARNLGGIWIQPRRAHDAHHAAGPEPWWPRLMRSAGRRVTRRWFRRADGPGGREAAPGPGTPA